VDVVKVQTADIATRIRVERLTSDKVDFNLKLDSDYVIDKGCIVLLADGTEADRVDIDVAAAISSEGWSSTLGYSSGTTLELLELRLEDIEYDGEPISLENANVIIKKTTASVVNIDESINDTGKPELNPEVNKEPNPGDEHDASGEKKDSGGEDRSNTGDGEEEPSVEEKPIGGETESSKEKSGDNVSDSSTEKASDFADSNESA
jgi:hypothetical protein